MTQSQQIMVILTMLLYFQYFVYRTQKELDTYLAQHSFLDQIRISVSPSLTVVERGHRYLVFKKIQQGQGIGNIMNGLLAVHMLGLEFNRTVCVANDWKEFHDAFQTLKNANECAQIQPQGSLEDSILLLNFVPPPNECRLQYRLGSKKPILWITSNTYPRWSVTPPGLWDTHYKPTKKLIQTLPYSIHPSTVVHLRDPDDDTMDHRPGLENITLKTLAETLPNHTFLVTNNILWYNFFESYGWKNPGWHKVRHSALGIEWGGQAETSEFSLEDFVDSKNTDEDNFHMWSDWFTILRAKQVYHTHSDFSLSAIHWNEIASKTIQGIDNITGKLILTDESWRIDTSMPRLVDRVGDQLKNCDKETDDMGGYFNMGDDNFDQANLDPKAKSSKALRNRMDDQDDVSNHDMIINSSPMLMKLEKDDTA
jgi:hypothetical protein